MHLITNQAVVKVVNEGKVCLFKRKDGKYLFCLPKDIAKYSMFPFRILDSTFVKLAFTRRYQASHRKMDFRIKTRKRSQVFLGN
jgi:hypothetical protein